MIKFHLQNREERSQDGRKGHYKCHPVSNKLLPTRSLSSTLATVTTSASFELAFLHANIVFFKLRISYLSSCTSPQVPTRKGNGELRAPRRRGMQENLQLSLSLQIIPASSSTFTNLRKASILYGSQFVREPFKNILADFFR